MGKQLVTEDDVKAVVAECAKVCAILRKLPEPGQRKLIDHVFDEAMTTTRDVEKRIEEAGVIPGDVAAVFMFWGAVAAIVEDLPATDDRRELVAAGRELGKFIAAKFGEKIRSELRKQHGDN